jgi:BirA family biotin operon repressor/biotin-[acetyl-CoA-carboxylase] ligase
MELQHLPMYSSVRVVEEVGSTNADLIKQAATLPDRSVLIARTQTAGQGRRGRNWASPKGTGIYCSILLRPTVPINSSGWISMLAGLALVSGVGKHGVTARLKWPNDLLIGEAKVAGILAELATNSTGYAVVVGFGLNVAPSVEPLPIRVGGLAPTNLTEHAIAPIDVDALLVDILTDFAAILDIWQAHDGSAISSGLHARYLATSATVGRRVRVELADGTIEVLASGVDAMGQLLVKMTDGTQRAISAGDVVHLR